MATPVTAEDLRELVMTHLDEHKVKDADRESLLEDLTSLIEIELDVLAERDAERRHEHTQDPDPTEK